jgi:hypothetical protein
MTPSHLVDRLSDIVHRPGDNKRLYGKQTLSGRSSQDQPEADFGMKMMDWTGTSEISQVTFPLFAWIASRRFTDCSAWPH